MNLQIIFLIFQFCLACVKLMFIIIYLIKLKCGWIKTIQQKRVDHKDVKDSFSVIASSAVDAARQAWTVFSHDKFKKK